MGIRNIRTEGDEILRKKSKPVKNVSIRTRMLIRDMFDTMYEADGVGLAAPQVGVLRRVIVIDVGGKKKAPICLINPVIELQEGSQITSEGCLSVPEISGKVERPDHVIVKGRDRNFKEITIEAKDLLAKALMHEMDHLDGIMFVDRMIEEDKPEKEEADKKGL